MVCGVPPLHFCIFLSVSSSSTAKSTVNLSVTTSQPLDLFWCLLLLSSFLFLHFISFAKSSLPLAGSSSCLLPPHSSSLKEHLFTPTLKLGQMRPIHASQQITSMDSRDHPGGCGAHRVTRKHTGVISSVCMQCFGGKTYLWIGVRFSVWCAVKNPCYLLKINEELDVFWVWLLKSKHFFSRNTRRSGDTHFLFFSPLTLPSPSFPFLLQ